MSKVLVVEDDVATAAAIKAALGPLGCAIETAPSAELGLERARRAPPDLVLLDLHLPGRTGLEALPELLALAPAPLVAIMTAHATAENAIEAMASGAAAHVAKPVEARELRSLVERLLAERAARDALGPLPGAAGGEPPRLVGRSRPMLDLGRRVGALARSDVPVLVRGESGTGKELVARAIHAMSARRGGPLVAISCAALPETLFEAELFGWERGAFTGAHRSQAGHAERAAGGTLFLDEVGELSPASQAKLLRFLEERRVERLGGGKPMAVDVRVIAATNAPLERRVEEGSFREDLYYRLHVAAVEVPPLRARREDVPLLLEHLLARAGRPEVRPSPEALALLLAHTWPGNVRELKNALDSALTAVGPGTELRPEHLPPLRALTAGHQERGLRPGRTSGGLEPVEPPPGGERGALLAELLREEVRRARAREAGEGPPAPGLWSSLREDVERHLLAAALEATQGNQVAAARLLDLNRATLRRKMAEYGMLSRGEPDGEAEDEDEDSPGIQGGASGPG